MAQITLTTLLDGPKNAAVHVSIAGDGTGELVDEVILDPAAFDPPLPPVPALRIAELWYNFVGFDSLLEFDYLASDTPVWSMSGGEAIHMDFGCIGGLTDRSNPLDGSGKLLLTTSGLEAGDFGTMVILVKKA